VNGETPAGRRAFLGRLSALLGGAIGATLAGVGLTAFLSPAFDRSASPWIRVGAVNLARLRRPRAVVLSFRRKDGWRVENGQAVVFLAKDGEGELLVLSAGCTHLGCGVRWDDDAERFLCPCHGGEFDATGQVVAGPPPRPMTRLETRFDDDGVLFVRGDGLGA
jgi:Rieske Fe-S protein